jgi:hypothetical protein
MEIKNAIVEKSLYIIHRFSKNKLSIKLFGKVENKNLSKVTSNKKSVYRNKFINLGDL